MLVSELLGSFGDNELSPECLDGAQRFLKADGVSIPQAYTSPLAPVTCAKLWNDAKAYRRLTWSPPSRGASPCPSTDHRPTEVFTPSSSARHRADVIDNSRYAKLRWRRNPGSHADVDPRPLSRGVGDAKRYERPAGNVHGVRRRRATQGRDWRTHVRWFPICAERPLNTRRVPPGGDVAVRRSLEGLVRRIRSGKEPRAPGPYTTSRAVVLGA